MKIKILVLGNPLNHEGGMVAFNKGLISNLNAAKKSYQLQHFSIGSRMSLFYYPILRKLIYPFLLVFDLIRLFFILINKNIKIIQYNPSLIPVPLVRDGLAQLINIIIFKKKSVIVLHGWKELIFKKIIDNKLYSYLIIKFFNSADVVFVLSEKFKSKLIDLGISKSKIKVTTTFFYNKDIIISSKQKPISHEVKFVYLGRVSKIKGMGELIEAIKIVKNVRQDFICEVIGHGDKPKTLNYYKGLVIENNLDDKIMFLGRKTGEEKFKILLSSDIYLLPSYMEGCPTTAIEALASGLFVISTDVGALDDIISGDNGIKVKPKQINELADAILNSIREIDKIRLKRKKITKDAFLNFEVNQIAEQFHKSYCSLIHQN